ncbi:TPA: hypothetical protein ACH3X2_007137 [Trebouxia sp. C0005]
MAAINTNATAQSPAGARDQSNNRTISGRSDSLSTDSAGIASVRRAARQEQQRRQDFEAALIADFWARVSAVPLYCHACKTPDFIQPLLPAAAITFACINGYATVESPEHICCSCHKYVAVHPSSVGCVPATPSPPEVWYDNQVLAVTVAAQLSGPTAVQAQCVALKQLYCSIAQTQAELPSETTLVKHQDNGSVLR